MHESWKFCNVNEKIFCTPYLQSSFWNQKNILKVRELYYFHHVFLYIKYYKDFSKF